MFNQFYSDLVFTEWFLYALLAFLLLIGPASKDERYKAMIRSKQYMSIGFMFFSIEAILFYFFEFRDRTGPMAICVNLSSYYLAGFHFLFCYATLLDWKPNPWSKYKRVLFRCIVCLAVLWSSWLFKNERAQSWIINLCTLCFFAEVVHMAIVYIRGRKKFIRNMDNYYSEDAAVYVKWLDASAIAMIVLGLPSAAMSYMPLWGVCLREVLSMFIFLTAVVAVFNYGINLNIISKAEEEATPEETVVEAPILSPVSESSNDYLQAMRATIANNIKKWVESGGPSQKDLNMNIVSRQIGTNRTYLSKYVNQVEKKTFRDWISGLRVERAKHLLVENPELSTEEIASLCGFTSQSNFSHQFKALTGVAPSKWRNEATR